MKKNIKPLIFAAVLAAAVVVSLFHINRILVPKYTLDNTQWPSTSTYNQFYQMEDNSVDVLFLGSSVVVNSFSPQHLYNEFRIRSYNLGSEQQTMPISYFWLKEALRHQFPEVVVLDVKFAQLNNESYGPVNMSEGLVRKSLDWMRPSPVKWEAVDTICGWDSTQSRMSYYFTNLRYHTRWTELTAEDFDREATYTTYCKGFSPIGDAERVDFEPDRFQDKTARQDMYPPMKDYLDKIVALCHENGIELVLVNIPGNETNDGIHNTFTEYAEQNHIRFIDFCEANVFRVLDADFPLVSPYQHANILGAERLTEYIGNYLIDMGVTRTYDTQYEKTEENYGRLRDRLCDRLERDALRHTYRLDAYLRYIKNEDFTVFLAVNEDGVAALTDKQIKLLRDLGLKSQFRELENFGYCAVVTPEKVQEKSSSEGAAEFTGTVGPENREYWICSLGQAAGSESYIEIEGEQYSLDGQGMNFVIYDNVKDEVVDQVVFNTHEDGSASR